MPVVSCRLSVVGCRLPVVSCRLSVVGCQLSVAGCQLSVAGCRLSVAGCRLSVVGCRLPVAGCQLPVVGCRLSVAGCRLPVVSCQLPVAGCRLAGWQVDKDMIYKNRRATDRRLHPQKTSNVKKYTAQFLRLGRFIFTHKCIKESRSSVKNRKTCFFLNIYNLNLSTNN